MSAENLPDFYTGSPVDPSDLRFRGPFLQELWETLETRHVLLTAPRRTGKTSVMDHLRDFPEADFSVISVNVQDLDHPADFFLTLLDTFHDKHPKFLRDNIGKGWDLLGKAFGKIGEVDFAEFKIALRDADPNWRDNWRLHGERFLKQARAAERPILFIIDELPDMLIELGKRDEKCLREFLAWFRTQRTNPAPKKDSLRWLVGGSINLSSTLDAHGMVDLINDFEDVELPVLSEDQIEVFVHDMLTGRGVPHDETVPARLIARLGRPIPLFMQMAVQDLYRRWKRTESPLTGETVDQVFDSLITTSAAKSKLQHYYTRIDKYYSEPKRSIAHALLSEICLSSSGLRRARLLETTERLLADEGEAMPRHARLQFFNQLLRDLENDFYISEVEDDRYDFTGGVLKDWWRKYYA